MKRLMYLCLFLCFFSLLILVPLAAADENPDLAEGIRQYNLENYEEAITELSKARQENTSSAMAAFFLGLSYKQSGDLRSALPHFIDAATLKPAVKEAVVELIDGYRQIGMRKEAKVWISTAEHENIYPAKVAFLKGMILQNEGDIAGAITAFERSKQIDPSYTQSADFQIGVSYMVQRKYSIAKERFEAAITQDPLSDLATYARRYQDIVEQRSYIERPLRLTINVMGLYDTNMLAISGPVDVAPPQYNIYANNAQKRSLATMDSIRLDYVPILEGPFIFNASYGAAATAYQKNGTSYNTIANSFSVAPGISIGNFAMNFLGNYTHVLRMDPSFKRYSEAFEVGPLFRYLVANGHILQFFAGYAGTNYFKTVENPELEDQSSCGFEMNVSWFWLFNENGIFNLKYTINMNNANGIDYDNRSHQIDANLIYPLTKKLKLQLSGDATFQDYSHENIFFFNQKRHDRIYTGSIGFIWDVHRTASLLVQYTYTYAYSNIYAYDYSRDIVSAGMELRF
jgi:tetratricopeptide (TPR) repeat protein